MRAIWLGGWMGGVLLAIQPLHVTASPLYAWVTGECDLHQAPCTARLHDGRRITLSITPREIPPLEPLQLSVSLEGFDAEGVRVRFTGVDVEMGELDYPLTPLGERDFAGRASLDVCSRRRMTWQALVVVQGRGEEVRAPFRFESEYRSRFTVIE